MWPKSCGGEFVVIERAGIADIFSYFMLIMANLKNNLCRFAWIILHLNS